MLDHLPDGIKQALWWLTLFLPTAFLARSVGAYFQARRENRQFLTADLAWQVPTAVFLAIVGGGFASHLAVSDPMQHAIVGLVSYVGPRGIDALVALAIRSIGR